MAGEFAFLPNARNSITRATTAPGGGSRLRLAYDLEIQANGAPAASVPRVRVETEVKGPGDIIGFNRGVISRIEPEPGLRGFEPNYIPFVEFIDADFPWRYSLDAGTGNRLQPWVLLITLKPAEFEFVDQGNGPLPRIRVFAPATSLPEIAKSWPFAHVQVDLTSGQPVSAAVAGNPAAHFSRLFSPRRLSERTDYHLFLVPAYEAGRLRGLGSDDPANPFDAPAWAAQQATPVELPVYFQSRFITNELEDVETLVRRLRTVTDAEAALVGTTPPASAARPGYYPDYHQPGETFAIQAALKQPGAAVESYNTNTNLANRLVTTLGEVIAGELVGASQDGPAREDPLVAMPPYGWRFRNQTTVSRAKAANGDWFDRINLDLKFRQAAGLGAATVRQNQELFAQKCWEQYQDILDANLRLQRLQWADLLVRRMADRRFARLPSDVAISLAEPLQPYVTVGAASTVLETIRDSGVPASFVSRGLRRIAAKRPIRIASDAGAPTFVIPTPAIPGDQTPDPRLQPVRAARRSTARPPAGDRQARFRPGVEAQLAPLFGAGAFGPGERMQPVGVPVAELSSKTLQTATVATLAALPAAKATLVIGGRLEAEAREVAPIYRSPVVPLPLATYLVQFAKEHILAGSDKLPENTVSAFEENRLFVEAFLAGANHEMNAELRWREFPTDMRGTIFRRFWDRGRPADDPAGDDIAQIHTWTKKLGEHFPPGAANNESDLVIVIRGDIVRKLGQMTVVLNEAAGTSWVSGQGTDHQVSFFGRIGPDVAFYGFDVSRQRIMAPAVKDRCFLVLYEPVGKLRFGLDIATATVRRQRQVYDKVSLQFPVAALSRSYDQIPGRIAGLYQEPPPTVTTWDDFSWSHVRQTGSGYIDSAQTIAVGSGPDYWGAGRTSASITRSLWQKPLAAVLPLKRVL